MKNLIETLRARGIVDAVTSDDLPEIVERQKPMRIYCGFDPTGDSLHLGHMMAIMGLAWFAKAEHIPVAVVGGATGLIGDPSGKSIERQLLTDEQMEVNISAIRHQLETILRRVSRTKQIMLLNNKDWFAPMTCIDFLRDVGRHFRIGTMISRESVKARLGSEEGLSYTEFSYQLLQAYDFYHLFDRHGVTLQLGGSDQWGNITAGIDFVRRLTGKEVYGLTWSLLLKSDGKKFGKTESGAVWLSEDKLSVYDFYQYLYRVADADVIRLLKALTFLDLEHIEALEESMSEPDYVPNTAQALLAAEVTKIVHGEDGLAKALEITEKALPGQVGIQWSAENIKAMLAHIPSTIVDKHSVDQVRVCDLLAACEFVSSKAEARRLISNGGVRVNDRKIVDELDLIAPSDLVEGRYILFSIGKKKRVIVEVK